MSDYKTEYPFGAIPPSDFGGKTDAEMRQYKVPKQEGTSIWRWLANEGWIVIATIFAFATIGGILMHAKGYGPEFWGLGAWFWGGIALFVAGVGAIISWLFHRRNRRGLPWVIAAVLITLIAWFIFLVIMP